MGSVKDELYYDYTYNTFLIKSMMGHLDNMEDRKCVVMWLRKIANSTHNVNELRLRNDFLYYLILNVQVAELRKPFNDYPPLGPLTELAYLLPGGQEAVTPNLRRSSTRKAETAPVQSKRPDAAPHQGEFLVGHTVPSCGAFCYLAMSSKDD